ncbi:MAG: helix-turn-helix domain-containing protein [Chloroflexota bacterium]
MRLSQDEFAAKFGFPPASIRNWEQGRRRPEGPARVLLAVIARYPEVVEEVLHAAK